MLMVFMVNNPGVILILKDQNNKAHKRVYILSIVVAIAICHPNRQKI